MKKVLSLALAASALLLADGSDADVLKTHTELSYVQTQGNTDTNAFSLDFAANKNWGAHKTKLDFDALYGTDGGIESKNKIVGEFNYDYQFSDHLALNYLAGYKRDRFSGFEYQLYTGPGLKYIALNSDAHKLDFQANVLYSSDESMDKYYDTTSGDEIKYPYPDGRAGATKVDGESDDYTGYVAKANYSWQVMENLKFLQEASYRGDFEESERYFVYSKTAFESKISDFFSMGISYKVDYTNLPPVGNEYSDRTFMTSLIIDY